MTEYLFSGSISLIRLVNPVQKKKNELDFPNWHTRHTHTHTYVFIKYQSGHDKREPSLYI